MKTKICAVAFILVIISSFFLKNVSPYDSALNQHNSDITTQSDGAPPPIDNEF